MTNEELYEALDKPKVVITLEEYENLRKNMSWDKISKAKALLFDVYCMLKNRSLQFTTLYAANGAGSELLEEIRDVFKEVFNESI